MAICETQTTQGQVRGKSAWFMSNPFVSFLQMPKKSKISGT